MRRTWALVGALAIALGMGAARGQAADPFAGRFSDGSVTAVIRSVGGERYTGELQKGGGRHPLRARKAAEGLEGSFRSQGHDYPVAMSVEGGVLLLRTGGVTYRLRRLGDAAPPARPTPPAAPTPLATPTGAPAPAGAATPAGYQRYRHPVGFSLSHPSTWRVQPVAGGLALVPPDLARTPQGTPAEACMVYAEKVAGVTRPDDPKVQAYLGRAFSQTLRIPLRPVGGAQSAPIGGRAGAAYTWEGQSPWSPTPIRVRAYATILRGYGVSLGWAGAADQLARRDPILRAIFQTLGADQGDRDPRYAGVWYRKTYLKVGTAGRGGLGGVSVRTMVLTVDGRLGATSQLALSGSQRAGAGRPGWDFTGGAPGGWDLGRWASRGEKVWLIWDEGGASEYRVHLQGTPGRREMLLRPLGGEKELWTEYVD